MIVFLDTETLGLDAERHPIWELAALSYDPDQDRVLDSFQLQIRVRNKVLADADPKALEINHFVERYDHATAVPRQEAWIAFASWMRFQARWPDGPTGKAVLPHLAGAVVSFDEERIRRSMRRTGLVETLYHYHLIDIEALAIGYLVGHHKGQAETASILAPDDESEPLAEVASSLPWKSSDLTAALGVPEPADEVKHTAMGDALWALELYRAVMG